MARKGYSKAVQSLALSLLRKEKDKMVKALVSSDSAITTGGKEILVNMLSHSITEGIDNAEYRTEEIECMGLLALDCKSATKFIWKKRWYMFAAYMEMKRLKESGRVMKNKDGIEELEEKWVAHAAMLAQMGGCDATETNGVRSSKWNL